MAKPKKGAKNPKGSQQGKGNKPEKDSDSRFSHAGNDPRFQRLPRSKRVVKVDERFSKMFTDDKFSSNVYVDKYGRRSSKKKSENLERFYEIEDEEEEKEKEKDNEKQLKAKKKLPKKSGKEEESSDSSDSSEEEDLSESSSDSDSSSSDEEVLSEDEESGEEVERGSMDDATCRLAVMNLDWGRVKSTDLLVLFNSFLPSGGYIKDVTVYPSEFGLEQMELENRYGPQGVWKKKEEGDDDDDGGDGMDPMVNERLRKYEKRRLSVKTATMLYKECEGKEFEHSSNFLDIRFVPDDVTFDQKPRDSSSDIPTDYEAPDFFTSALQLTNVRLTWDQDDPVRSEKLRKRLSKEDLKKMDLEAYIGSEDDSDAEGSDAVISMSDDDSDGEEKGKAVLKRRARNKYASLLGELDPEAENKEDEDMGGLEVVFEPGLKEAANKILQKSTKSKNTADMTVWDKYLEKRKAKRKERRAGKMKDEEEKEKDSLYEDDIDMTGMNDPFFDLGDEFEDNGKADDAQAIDGMAEDSANAKKEKKKKNSRKDKEEEMNKDMELELLMMGENGDEDAEGYNLKQMIKEQKKSKKKKNKKEKSKEKNGAKNSEDFSVDMSDSRFQALFDKPEFHIDPTNPKYKPTAGSEAILGERQKRMVKKRAEMETNLKNRKRKMASKPSSEDANNDLKSLIDSVKAKSKKHTSRLDEAHKRLKTKK